MSEEGRLSGRLIASGGHELLQRVYFEDTDFSGRVYHARYLNFLERGRSDYLRLLGISHRELADVGLVFAVRRMSIEYLRPAAIDDVLTVRTVPASVGGARIELFQQAARGPVTLVEASVTVVLVRADGRPGRVPKSLLERFDADCPMSGRSETRR